ncbi:hypothetical protein [Paraliobacillus ryukyuensis]|uniref:hypothetical protein n=1 Tax=Paraliobacillus ryukyuensis TaxID=200904 RepID=UPI0009A7DA19|nr:hypothetical protein [Paraliobacillus ryukyuensis]
MIDYKGHLLNFPDMLEDATSHFPDESCWELIRDNPQRSVTNRMAALLVNNIMNNLFHSQSIYNHVLNFNAQTGMNGGRVGFITKQQFEPFNHSSIS